MRDFASLPNDLPMPGALVPRAAAPKRGSPYGYPRTDVERVERCRQIARDLGMPPANSRYARGDGFLINGLGQLSTKLEHPEPTAADIEMICADGGLVAENIERVWHEEATAAEDAAIRKLDVETQDAEAHFKASSAVRGATPINYANAVGYLTEVAHVLDEQDVPQHGRMLLGVDPGDPQGDSMSVAMRYGKRFGKASLIAGDFGKASRLANDPAGYLSYCLGVETPPPARCPCEACARSRKRVDPKATFRPNVTATAMNAMMNEMQRRWVEAMLAPVPPVAFRYQKG